MFNLSDYEDVATLNKWFIDNYPLGRTNIEITYHDPEKGYITCRAEVYRDINDPTPYPLNFLYAIPSLRCCNAEYLYLFALR